MGMGIIQMSYNDAMSYTRTGPQLLCLSEMEEWNRNATIPHNGLIEWRLMGHTMVPTAQAYGSGLEHDCSTWDEMYGEDDGEDPNAWNAPDLIDCGIQKECGNDLAGISTRDCPLAGRECTEFLVQKWFFA